MEQWIIELIKATDLFGKVNAKIAGIPNPYILTYILEAVDAISSNDIENIHTTVDEAYDGIIEGKKTPFHNYREALKVSHKSLQLNEIIRSRDIKRINKMIRGIDGDYRKIPVSIRDSKDRIVHNPPAANKIPEEMDRLINLINQDRDKNQILNSLDIHHKFEWIHPFSDGNGRTGRIIFALLLNKYGILDIPASIFSYSIMKKKYAYYKALHHADNGEKKKYYEIMLCLLNDSLQLTIDFINQIKEKMEIMMDIENNKKREIIKYLFSGVKTSNRYICKKTNLNNKTVSKYIDELIEEGVILKERKSKYIAYKNIVLERLIIKAFNNLK